MRLPLPRVRRWDRRGLMLIECLVYISLWLMVTGFAFTLFYQAVANSKRLTRNADDMVRVLKVGERWREDVRGSTKAGPLVDPSAPADEELLLNNAQGWIRYQFMNGRVLRRTQADDNWREILNGVKTSRMVQDDRGDVQAWRWEIELLTHAERPVVRPLFTFQAVPRRGNGR